MDKEELEKLKKGTTETVDAKVKELNAEIQKKLDAEKVNAEAQKKTIADLETKINDMSKIITNKSFFIGQTKFPKLVKIGGGMVDVENLGREMNALVSAQANKSAFNIIGKDCEAYYNMKCYLAALYRSVADKNNNYPELKTLVKEYAQKANEMLEGGPTTGGSFVPAKYETELIMLNRQASPIIQECNTFTISSPTVYWPKEGTGITAYIVGENAAITASHVSSDQYSLSAKKFGVLTEGISKELINDSVFDFVGYLTNLIMYTLWRKVGYEVFFGASGTWGTNIGVTTAIVTNAVEVSGNPGTRFAGLTPDEFSSAKQKLTSEDREICSMKWGSLITHYLQTLKDNNGQYLYRTPQGELPNKMWGRPWNEDVNLELSDATNTTFAVVGNFKRFDIASIVGEMGIEADPYTNFATDLVRFKMTMRKALGIRRVEAFCRVKTKAS